MEDAASPFLHRNICKGLFWLITQFGQVNSPPLYLACIPQVLRSSVPPSKAVVLNWGWLCSLDTFCNIWRHFWLSRIGGRGVLLASSGYRPGMPLNLCHTGETPKIKNFPAPNTNSVEVLDTWLATVQHAKSNQQNISGDSVCLFRTLFSLSLLKS